MSHTAQYIHVLLPGLWPEFDYLPAVDTDASHYQPGARVRVPLGRRTVVGLVSRVSASSDVAAERLKPVEALLERQSLFSSDQLKLGQWLAEYYHSPGGDALLTMLPALLRKGKVGDAYEQTQWRISDHGLGLLETALARAPRQQALLNWLRDNHQQGQPWADSESMTQAGFPTRLASTLREKSLVESRQATAYPANCGSVLVGPGDQCAATPNREQAQALAMLAQQRGKFAVTLLDGVTGSGKTEVYLQAIAAALAAGGQVLVLIPEIGLTPQTIARFTRRLAEPVAVLHSGLNDRERLAAWQAAANGYARVIVGTRSAVFCAAPDLSLIIIDEEHDSSYKQMDGMRYSARDVAIKRAQDLQIPVVLGSATPALETLHNVARGRYAVARLQQRAGDIQLPDIELLDTRREQLQDGFSDHALALIGNTLGAGQQVLVFINRRGFAPVLMCHDCGWHAQCEHCDARLTLHQSDRSLRCHHCDHRQALPSSCPRCLSTQLLRIGQGTERTEAALAARFPGVELIRIDRDTARGKQALGEQLARVNSGQAAILVGTQMLAKGHHFEHLQTVIALDIDNGLFSPDFRSPERTLQLLTQVAGRAGRSRGRGQVLVQTHLPDHPLLQCWQEGGYHAAVTSLLEERKVQALPPFMHLALLRADHHLPSQAERFLAELQRRLHSPGASNGCQVVGPISALMEKKAGRHRAQLICKAASRQALHQTLERLRQLIDSSKTPSGMRWSIDVDPSEVA